MLARTTATIGLAGSVLLSYTHGFYLPGVAPRDYSEGETVELKVNTLDSAKTQLPYFYYNFGFCKPDVIEDSRENLGEVLSGDVIQNSPYQIFMKHSEKCKVLCKSSLSESDIKFFKFLVAGSYKVNWIVDNLPAATKYYMQAEEGEASVFTEGDVKFAERFQKGFDVGFMGSKDIAHSYEGQAYINNHHKLILYYHQVEKPKTPAPSKPAPSTPDVDNEEESSSSSSSSPSTEDDEETGLFRIVGFEVEPFSVKHTVKGDWKGTASKLHTCSSNNPVTRDQPPQSLSATEKELIWTYDVEWRSSEVKWASRWDLYLKMSDSEIHWFSIVNSVVIIVFLAAMVALILVRTLNRDMRKYNEILEMTEEEQQEETGWKLIHGDVFRPPANGEYLAIFYGIGTQLIAMIVICLVFAAFGILSPANRGALMTAFVVLFVCMGFVAGYFSTRTYQMFNMKNWSSHSLKTALLIPGVFFMVYFILNLFVWGEKSSGAVPFPTLLALLALWLCVSVPLTYAGSYVANSRGAIVMPLRVNNIPREIKSEEGEVWYNGPVACAMMSSLLPFGAVFIELFFIMSSVWLHQFYYVFGFLLIVFVVMLVTCAEVSICMCYFQLCSENYHWWWRSFFNSGFSAVYLFLYSILYFTTKLEITSFVSALLYFGYMFLFSLAFFLVTGSIGFISCYYFVKKIYLSIKID